ncbi:MAG: hypothetical protein LBR08_03135 [Bacteroidales bacterium]|jgi:hypothetical protein|nr:hypothetical protein [Bacteroidales bacterium]
MAKSRKKSKGNTVSAKQKLHYAQYRNEVMDKLRFLCTMIDGSASLFHLLPEGNREGIFQMRGTLRVISGEGKKIQRRLAEVMEKGLKDKMREVNIEVIKGSGRTISLYDFMLVGMPLYLMLRQENYFKGKALFEPFYNSDDDVRARFIGEVEKHVPLYCEFYSDLKRNVLYDYWMDTKRYIPVGGETISVFRFCLQVIIEPFKLAVKSFKIQNETHLGTELCRFYYDMRQNDTSGLAEISVALKDIEPGTRFPDLRMRVYIQQHAVERLMERTYCPFPNWIFTYLVRAMLDPKVIRLSEDRFLFEYHMVDIKIGYLAVQKVEGELLIRTFLFITNNGTPEGRKLEELTGLQKEDKKYLSIDNLRTLANSDIEQNETIHDIFLKAGFAPILELCKRVRENDKNFRWLMDGKSEQKASLSQLIIEYLKPDADNDEFVEIEDLS